MKVCFVCINWALVLIAWHYTKSANDLLIWISFMNKFVNGGVLEPYWWGSWGTEDKMVGKHSPSLRICLEVVAIKRKTFCYNQVMSRSEMQLNAGKTEWSHHDRPQSLTTICWTDLRRFEGVFLVSVGQILLGMRGLLLWSGSPCGEREEQKATQPPLLQEQLQRAADIFWLCNGRQSLCLPIRWGLGIRAEVGEGTNGGRKLGFACNYCTLWPTSSFLSLTAEIHSSSWRLVCEWDWMHHFSCMARGRLSLLPDKKKSTSLSYHLTPCCFFPIKGLF